MNNKESEEKIMREFYTCKRMRMLSFFKERGFLPEKTIPNVDNPRFNVWLFRWDDAFNNVLTEYWSDKVNK